MGQGVKRKWGNMNISKDYTGNFVVVKQFGKDQKKKGKCRGLFYL
jgi:hypothetical protein